MKINSLITCHSPYFPIENSPSLQNSYYNTLQKRKEERSGYNVRTVHAWMQQSTCSTYFVILRCVMCGCWVRGMQYSIWLLYTSPRRHDMCSSPSSSSGSSGERRAFKKPQEHNRDKQLKQLKRAATGRCKLCFLHLFAINKLPMAAILPACCKHLGALSPSPRHQVELPISQQHTHWVGYSYTPWSHAKSIFWQTWSVISTIKTHARWFWACQRGVVDMSCFSSFVCSSRWRVSIACVAEWRNKLWEILLDWVQYRHVEVKQVCLLQAVLECLVLLRNAKQVGANHRTIKDVLHAFQGAKD